MRPCHAALALVLLPVAAFGKPAPSPVTPVPKANKPQAVAAAKPRITFRAVASRPNVWLPAQEAPRALFALGMGMPRDYAWSFAREYLRLGRTPHPVEMRADGFYNAFDYDDPAPKQGWFSTTIEGAPSPFTPGRQLVRIAVRGPLPSHAKRAPLGISFIVMTAGGTDDRRRFVLAQQMMREVVAALQPDDTVQLTTGGPQVLPPTPAREHAKIMAAIDGLATSHAPRHVNEGGGRPNGDQVNTMAPEPPSPGASLSIWVDIGQARQLHKDFFTIGLPLTAKNFDAYISQAGQGVYDSYRIVGTPDDAKRAIARELPEMLELLGQNLRVEVAFDPKRVNGYRLLGFDQGDPVEAGDFASGRLVLGPFGAGFALSALYELELDGDGDGLGTVTVRADDFGSAPPHELVTPLTRAALRPTLAAASPDLRFAAAAAGAGDALRGVRCAPAGPSVPCSDSPAVLGFGVPEALTLARGAVAGKAERKEFVRLLAAAPGAKSKPAKQKP